MKDFKKLIVWQKSIDLVTAIYRAVEKLPPDEKYALVSQLRRAAVSIPSNIAEGSAKSTTGHYKMFLEHALGSSYEVETQLIVVERVYCHLSDHCKDCLERTREIQRMLISFIAHLKY
jgi:four helix bundle protein